MILDICLAGMNNNNSVRMWFETKDVVFWFRNVEDPMKSKFLQFDIDDYYPSISEGLFNSALTFGRNRGLLSTEDIEILRLARTSILDMIISC